MAAAATLLPTLADEELQMMSLSPFISSDRSSYSEGGLLYIDPRHFFRF